MPDFDYWLRNIAVESASINLDSKVTEKALQQWFNSCSICNWVDKCSNRVKWKIELVIQKRKKEEDLEEALSIELEKKNSQN